MRLTIIKSGVCLALYLGILVSLPGLAQAAINDHRSPDGTCNGVPEPPTPAGTGCEVKLCTNDGDWMCCNKCTISGGYCCEQMVTSISKGSRIRIPGGRLQKAPEMTTTTPSTSTSPKAGMNAPTSPIMRRGIEGDKPDQSASEQASRPSGDVQEGATPLQSAGGLGAVAPSCSCHGGNGTCTVTTTKDKATCSKGKGTCTGTCEFVPGTGTGVSGALLMR